MTLAYVFGVELDGYNNLDQAEATATAGDDESSSDSTATTARDDDAITTTAEADVRKDSSTKGSAAAASLPSSEILTLQSLPRDAAVSFRHQQSLSFTFFLTLFSHSSRRVERFQSSRRSSRCRSRRPKTASRLLGNFEIHDTSLRRGCHA